MVMRCVRKKAGDSTSRLLRTAPRRVGEPPWPPVEGGGPPGAERPRPRPALVPPPAGIAPAPGRRWPRPRPALPPRPAGVGHAPGRRGLEKKSVLIRKVSREKERQRLRAGKAVWGKGSEGKRISAAKAERGKGSGSLPKDPLGALRNGRSRRRNREPRAKVSTP